MSSREISLRFKNPELALSAAKTLRASGVDHIEAFGPYPHEALMQETVNEKSKLAPFAFVFGALGGVSAYALQYWTAAVQYPLNIGGRPLHSWPAFIPITFELTVLSAVLAIIAGFLFFTKLPSPHHRVFAIKDFERATDDQFFLVVDVGSQSPHDDFFRTLGAEEVTDVP